MQGFDGRLLNNRIKRTKSNLFLGAQTPTKQKGLAQQQNFQSLKSEVNLLSLDDQNNNSNNNNYLTSQPQVKDSQENIADYAVDQQDYFSDNYGDQNAYTQSTPYQEKSLIIVSNRLPIIANRNQDSFTLKPSAGGLATAMSGIQDYQIKWVGWPGHEISKGADYDQLKKVLLEKNLYPVKLDSNLVDLYYNGFCNTILWNLFHYVPLNMEARYLSDTRTIQKQWDAYRKANQIFAREVLKIYNEGDIVWVQDYHLMLLPKYLKQHSPEIELGWFLHTPFPSSEIYRTLPFRNEVLSSVLAADLVAFHTYDYARHFISCCLRILGLESTPEGVEDNGYLTRVLACPIGIMPQKFTETLQDPVVKKEIMTYLAYFGGRKVMLGVDRMDVIKGIPNKLLAFEKFLEENEHMHDKVVMIQIAVPSRQAVAENQSLSRTTNEIVTRINGRYGTLTSMPVVYLHRELEFKKLVALYSVTDVCLITSLRDGMNLVSYEYVACQKDNCGVLILSEFAGAAQSLGAGALLVNPCNIQEVSQTIKHALNMSETEKKERHKFNYEHVMAHTAQYWADTFLQELQDTHIEAALRTKHHPPEMDQQSLTKGYQVTNRRLIVLGYNATLTMVTNNIHPGKDGQQFISRQESWRQYQNGHLDQNMLTSINNLASDPKNVIVIVSGSRMEKLLDSFGSCNIWLLAENGVFFRPSKSAYEELLEKGHLKDQDSNWNCLFTGLDMDWQEPVKEVFDYFRERTPRSILDIRETSMVWYYKYSDLEFGRLQARDLLQHLCTGPISNAQVDIVNGAKSVEVRPVGVSKGVAMQRMVTKMREWFGVEYVDFDFALCIGHFTVKDENIFQFFEGGGKLAFRDTNSQQYDEPPSPITQSQYQNETPRYHSQYSNRNPQLDLSDLSQHRIVEEELSPDYKSREENLQEYQQRNNQQSVPVAPLNQQQLWYGYDANRSYANSPDVRQNSQSSDKVWQFISPKHLFTCTVGRARSQARYQVPSSNEVYQIVRNLEHISTGYDDSKKPSLEGQRQAQSDQYENIDTQFNNLRRYKSADTNYYRFNSSKIPNGISPKQNSQNSPNFNLNGVQQSSDFSVSVGSQVNPTCSDTKMDSGSKQKSRNSGGSVTQQRQSHEGTRTGPGSKSMDGYYGHKFSPSSNSSQKTNNSSQFVFAQPGNNSTQIQSTQAQKSVDTLKNDHFAEKSIQNNGQQNCGNWLYNFEPPRFSTGHQDEKSYVTNSYLDNQKKDRYMRRVAFQGGGWANFNKQGNKKLDGWNGGFHRYKSHPFTSLEPAQNNQRNIQSSKYLYSNNYPSSKYSNFNNQYNNTQQQQTPQNQQSNRHSSQIKQSFSTESQMSFLDLNTPPQSSYDDLTIKTGKSTDLMDALVKQNSTSEFDDIKQQLSRNGSIRVSSDIKRALEDSYRRISYESNNSVGTKRPPPIKTDNRPYPSMGGQNIDIHKSEFYNSNRQNNKQNNLEGQPQEISFRNNLMLDKNEDRKEMQSNKYNENNEVNRKQLNNQENVKQNIGKISDAQRDQFYYNNRNLDKNTFNKKSMSVQIDKK